MQVFLDESGDMGWRFTAPYRHGGSSRYLCLAFLFLPAAHSREAANIITAMYRQYQWRREKKAADATLRQKMEFCQRAVAMLQQCPSVKIDCIIAKKENVQEHIRSDANKLYNYMCGLVIPGHVRRCDSFEFVPDRRSIKIESGNSLPDYLQTLLWFNCRAKTKLINAPQESHRNHNLQFVDWVTHCVWINFEDRISAPFDLLAPAIRLRRLYLGE